MKPMTTERRNELSWAKNAKLIRLGIYDVGIVLGAILLADKTAMVAGFWPLRLGQYSPEEISVFSALALWVGLIFKRYSEMKAIETVEKGLDRDELERETGPLSRDELKNLGLD
jgi:hypothetical protein